MREVLEYIARNLAAREEQIEVTEVEEDGKIVLRLRVAPEDMGKVIGKGGRTARAIRAVVRAAGTRVGKAAAVEIVE